MGDPTVKQEKSEGAANPSDGRDTGRRRTRTPKKKSSDQHNEVLKDVVARIQSLRSAAKETSRSYLSNLERGILEIIDAVNGVGTEGKRGLKTDTLEKLVDVRVLGPAELLPGGGHAGREVPG